jgi:hypothetical protein
LGAQSGRSCQRDEGGTKMHRALPPLQFKRWPPGTGFR